MLCPYCNRHIHFDPIESTSYFEVLPNDDDVEGHRFVGGECPACEGVFVLHLKGRVEEGKFGGWYVANPKLVSLVFPRHGARKPPPPEVPQQYAGDYQEASLVLDDSPKASAALSRRCLQNIIREHFGIKDRTLDKEIEALLATGKLPSYVAEVVDAVRTVGNLAAHPTKDQHTGEIVDVEPGEAEWLLEVLDSLFDFCFVQPARQEQKKAALNAKLQSLGKPVLKK